MLCLCIGNGEVKERYVSSLVNVVQSYLKLKKELGYPTVRPPGFEPGITGLGGQRPNPG